MPSTTFLFWNINRKPLAATVALLAESHRVDVIILAESRIEPREMLQSLNASSVEFHFQPGQSERIAMFTRFSGNFLKPSFESERISIRRLALPARDEVLLAAVHLPSKLHWTSESQSFECSELGRKIVELEDRFGHRRTVLVGDFNMNPFESGFAGAAGLHSVMSRRIAAREVRTVQGREYRFFYNPMWGHFGDRFGDTAGSYYYESAEHVCHFWNMFDQVLLRPELAACFDASKLKIVTVAGDRSLVRVDGRPEGVEFSDHLPLVFELAF